MPAAIPTKSPLIAAKRTLSRLMKDGIGEGFTRADHPMLTNQLFALYAKVGEVRALSSVIGEEELTETDRMYFEFGKAFEQRFVSQNPLENRVIERTLDIGWELCSMLPDGELDRLGDELKETYLKRR